MKAYSIYTLTDPFTREIIYVGMTSNKKNRRKDHFYNTFSHSFILTKKIAWIKCNDALPIIDFVKNGLDKESAMRLEASIISKLKPICNIQHNDDYEIRKGVLRG